MSEAEKIISCPAKFADTMNCTAGGDIVRLTFGESMDDIKNYHTALVFKRADLLTFVTGIIQMLETKQ